MDTIKRILDTGEIDALRGPLGYLPGCNDPFVLSYLTKNLGICFPSVELIPVLTPYLKHPDERVIANTIEGLEAIGAPDSVADFSQLLAHGNHRISTNAAKALARFDREKATGVLARMLEHFAAPHLAIAACHAVKVLREPRLLPALGKALLDPLIREEALRAMIGIGGEEVAVSLRKVDQRIFSDEQRRLISSFFRQLGRSMTNDETDSTFHIAVNDRRIFVLGGDLTRSPSAMMPTLPF